MPIRVRVALLGVGVIALTLLLFSVLLFLLMAHAAPRQQDRTLTQRAQQEAGRLQRLDAEDLRPRRTPGAADLSDSLDVFVEVLGPDGAPLSSTGTVNGAAPVIPVDVLTTADAAGGAFATVPPAPGIELRVRVQPWSRPDLGLRGYLVTGQSTRQPRAQAGGLLAFLILAGITVLLVAAGAIWFVLGRALRPLKTVAHTAGGIARTGDLSRRLPPVRTRDEVRLLTDSFNGMLERLQDTYRRLGQALESQKRFVADASHELRTPLTTIRTNAGFLLQHRDVADEDREAALHDIAGESERMGRLVHNLLTLARADTGQRLEQAPLNLVPVIRDVCRQAQSLHPGRCIELEEEGAVTITGNADALRQLAWILVDNAARHTPARGRIRLWLGARRELALLQVSDEGPGIAPAELPRIFERFYRADAARSGGGAGLGLAIARWIAEEHGGRVLAYNNVEGGATFRVELPLARPATPERPAPADQRLSPNS